MLAVELPCQRHDAFHDLVAVAPGVFLVPVGAAHAGVGDGDKVLIAKLLPYAVAHLDQLVIQLVQLLLPGCYPAPAGGVGRAAHPAVGGLHIGDESGEVVLLAVKLDLGGSHQLLILAGQLVFFHQVFHDLGLEYLALHLVFFQQMGAVLLGDVILIRALQHDARGLGADLLKTGQLLIKGVVLLVVELILGVDGVADMRQRPLGGQVTDLVIQRLHGVKQLLRAARLFHPAEQCFALIKQGVEVRALIFHLAEFGHQLLLLSAAASGRLYQ